LEEKKEKGKRGRGAWLYSVLGSETGANYTTTEKHKPEEGKDVGKRKIPGPTSLSYGIT